MRFSKFLKAAAAILPVVGSTLYAIGAANETVLGVSPAHTKQLGVVLTVLGIVLLVVWPIAEALADSPDRERFRSGLGRLSNSEQDALREVVKEGHKEAVEFSDEHLEGIRAKTTFLTLAPKMNTITRYLVSPEWREGLERWARPTLGRRITDRWKDAGFRSPVFSKKSAEIAVMNLRRDAREDVLRELAHETSEASATHVVDAESAETSRVRRELEEALVQRAAAEVRAKEFFQQLRYGRRLIDYDPSDSRDYPVMIAAVQELTVALDNMLNRAAALWAAFAAVIAAMPPTSAVPGLYRNISGLDASFVRYSHRLLTEDLAAGRDPRPALVAVYWAYRGWREEIVAMLGFATTGGTSFVTMIGPWLAAEKEFLAEFEKKRRITLLGGTAAHVTDADSGRAKPLGEL